MKYSSLKTLVLFFFVTMVAFSCKKLTPDITTGNNTQQTGPYYVRFKTNGVQKEFKTPYIPVFDSIMSLYNNKLYLYQFGASMLTGSSFETVQLGISYGNYIANNANNNIFLESRKVFGIHPEVMLVYGKDASSSYFSPSVSGISVYRDNTITITELTETTVKGNFSGSVYNDNGEKVVLSNGEFFVPVKVN